MARPERYVRPPTPAGNDPSRAAQRAADPRGWRFPDAEREVVHRVIAERRDIRRFRPDPVPDDVLERVLASAHRAPSVGLMQPWRFIVVRATETRVAVRALAQRERLRQAERFGERNTHFLDQKVEGVLEAPLGICVCCDHGEPGVEVLGRGTIPETDVYSAACAVQNLWLAARAEGLGVGWVSFYRPDDLRALLGIPAHADPIAYLCLGWPDERPVRPGLEAAGWAGRMPLDEVVMEERWAGEPVPEPAVAPRREAVTAVRDRADQLVKPLGSLGALEALTERWAGITGRPPPEQPRAGVLLCAGDHGHTVHGTSLYGSRLSAQVAAAAARGETAAGVLAATGGHRLLVADVGLEGPTPPGVAGHKVAPGTADVLAGPAMDGEQCAAALAAGEALARELASDGVDCLVLGEIGIGNTATTAALASALTGAPPELTVGRGTGVDAEGLRRKRELVAAALDRHAGVVDAGPRAVLAALGGLELAALAGAVRAAWELSLPVILDGYATAVAALVAVRLHPPAGEGLIAGHRSAEPGHDRVLVELGLEPLLDLRLRLGEASGALLALPLVAQAGVLHRRMATFAEARVDG